MTTQEKLERIQYRATLYELVAERGAERILIGYGAKSRSALYRMVVKQAPRLVALTGRDAIDFAPRAADGATMGDWRIHFTGRTHREAILEGEFAFIAA